MAQEAVMADDALAATLQALEEHLLQPAIRANKAALEALLAPEFREFGSSGRVFDRPAIIALLAAEDASAASLPVVTEFRCNLLAPGRALVTYTLVRQAGPSSLRSSIWVEREGSWRMHFHQGTRMATEV